MGETAVRAFLRDWFRSFEDLAFKVLEINDLRNGVVFALIHQTGRPVGIAGIVQQQEARVTAWAGHLIVRVASYTDIEEARAAAERLAQERA